MTDREETRRLMERLVADPAFRARFERDPSGTAREAGLHRVARSLAAEEGSPILPLEGRESRSSLAGAFAAAAAEGIALFDYAGHAFGADAAWASSGNGSGSTWSPDEFGVHGTGGPVTPETDALLHDANVVFDAAGTSDLQAGRIDPRVVSLLTDLSHEHKLVISSMASDHSELTTGGSVSNHYYGRAFDIASIDGKPVDANNAVAKALAISLPQLDPSIRPSEIGSPWALPGAAYFTDADHQNHLHIGYDAPITPSWQPPPADGAPPASAAAPAPAAAPAAAAAPAPVTAPSPEGGHAAQLQNAAPADVAPDDSSDEDSGADDSGDDDASDEDSDSGDDSSDDDTDAPGEGSNGEDANDDSSDDNSPPNPSNPSNPSTPSSDASSGDNSPPNPPNPSNPSTPSSDASSGDNSPPNPSNPSTPSSDENSDDSSDDNSPPNPSNPSTPESPDSPPASPASATPDPQAAAPVSASDLAPTSSGYPGDHATSAQVAQWMGAEAQKRGLPAELPVMAGLVESGLRNLDYGDADSVGLFQMRESIWNSGPYAGYANNPELQLKWFLDHAEAVKQQRVAAGLPVDDPKQYGNWVADIERPADQFRGRYQLRLDEAHALLHQAAPAPGNSATRGAGDAQVFPAVTEP